MALPQQQGATFLWQRTPQIVIKNDQPMPIDAQQSW